MQLWNTLAVAICCAAPILESIAAETQPAPVMTLENDYAAIAVGPVK